MINCRAACSHGQRSSDWFQCRSTSSACFLSEALVWELRALGSRQRLLYAQVLLRLRIQLGHAGVLDDFLDCVQQGRPALVVAPALA